jgi:PTH1 family peptidyl-tRNA hydrolase
MKDIIAQLGNNTKISRFKIGISHPVYGDTVNYVLGTFSEDEKELLRPAVQDAAEAAICWLQNDITVTMNRFNGKAINNPK